MKLFRYLKRAVSMPPHIVLQKAVSKFTQGYFEERERKRDAALPTYAASSPKGGWVLAPRLLDLSKALSLVPTGAVLEKSRRILTHEFDLLGSGWVQVKHGMKCAGLEGALFVPGEKVTADSEGRWLLHLINEKNLPESRRIWSLIEQNYEPIDWQLDFKSGYRWSEGTMSRDIAYGGVRGQDVKVPWELARMQHLPALAWSFGLAGQKKDGFLDPGVYAKEFRNQILDFTATNPPRYGVNWSCTMDVGIRVANWALAYDLFRSLGAVFDAPFEETLARSVYEHAHHIRHHLEWDPVLRSNHYLADIAGLVWASAYLLPGKEEERWFSFALKELSKEVGSQFGPDGANFEASTSYHRLSAEMVVYTTALVLGLSHEEDGVSLTVLRDHWEKFTKMPRFTLGAMKPDGKSVQIGDNDSGRFFKPVPVEENSMNHHALLAAFNGLLDQDDLFASSKEFEAEDELIVALAEHEIIAVPAEKIEATGLADYPDFGLYRMAQGPWWLCVRCGPVGQKGNGGHAHNDQLSFELCVEGESCLVDPGTYVYTPLPEERNKFRSTAAHNTLSLNGLEQSPFGPEMFRLKDKAQAKVVEFKDGLFIGEHKGFGAIHRRTFRLEEGGVTGLDECAGKGTKAIYFHAAPGWEARLAPGQGAQLSRDGKTVLLESADGQWSVEDGFYSPEYGKKESAKTLVLKSDAAKIAWKIQTGDK